MNDIVNIWLPDAEKTAYSGESLASSLYGLPVTILLTGELGAGKTTFLKGFAAALGISDDVISPTFALEQRYPTADYGEFLHLDLFRLESKEAERIIEESSDHKGIRCIEWADRLPRTPAGAISIHIDEKDDGRMLTVSFDDIPLPSQKRVEDWRKQMHLNNSTCSHCDSVAALAKRFGTYFLENGIIVRLLALQRAGELHDLMRFVDFEDNQSHVHESTDEDQAVWSEWKKQYEGFGHEQACAAFLRDEGFSAFSDIILTHGPTRDWSPPRKTIEQKLLYYADKRVKYTEVVSVEERFKDFRDRYSSGKETPLGRAWREEALVLEQELFPGGPPF